MIPSDSELEMILFENCHPLLQDDRKIDIAIVLVLYYSSAIPRSNTHHARPRPAMKSGGYVIDTSFVIQQYALGAFE